MLGVKGVSHHSWLPNRILPLFYVYGCCLYICLCTLYVQYLWRKGEIIGSSGAGGIELWAALSVLRIKCRSSGGFCFVFTSAVLINQRKKKNIYIYILRHCLRLSRLVLILVILCYFIVYMYVVTYIPHCLVEITGKFTHRPKDWHPVVIKHLHSLVRLTWPRPWTSISPMSVTAGTLYQL